MTKKQLINQKKMMTMMNKKCMRFGWTEICLPGVSSSPLPSAAGSVYTPLRWTLDEPAETKRRSESLMNQRQIRDRERE